MTEPFRIHEGVPPLSEPVLVVALNGWIDAGGAAAAAMAIIEQESAAVPVATFDGDTYIDYRARRPTMEIVEGVHAALSWPTIELRAGRDAQGSDLLLLSGPEPDMAWHSFCAATRGLAEQFGVKMMVSLGAYPFATPHTRPSRLSVTSPTPAAIDSADYLKSSAIVPAGISAALAHEIDALGAPAVGLWAQVPHYVSAMAYPAATVALLEGLRGLAGVDVDASAARQEAIVQRQRLDELVAGNSEHESMVSQLERIYDASAETRSGFSAADLPSGDELAEEVERFLRDQGKGS